MARGRAGEQCNAWGQPSPQGCASDRAGNKGPGLLFPRRISGCSRNGHPTFVLLINTALGQVLEAVGAEGREAPAYSKLVTPSWPMRDVGTGREEGAGGRDSLAEGGQESRWHLGSRSHVTQSVSQWEAKGRASQAELGPGGVGVSGCCAGLHWAVSSWILRATL